MIRRSLEQHRLLKDNHFVASVERRQLDLRECGGFFAVLIDSIPLYRRYRLVLEPFLDLGVDGRYRRLTTPPSRGGNSFLRLPP